MTQTIRLPEPLIADIRTALNRAKDFKYPGALKKTSYDLAAMLTVYMEAATKALKEHDPGEDPTTCPKCGMRTEELDPDETGGIADGPVEWCRNCGFVFRLDFNP